MVYSADGLPHVRQVPGQDGQYILVGFTEHGMPQIVLTAEGIAKMIVGTVEFEETGLPRVFKTTASRVACRRENIPKNTPQARSRERSSEDRQ